MIYVDRGAVPAPERLPRDGEARAASLRQEFEKSKFAQRDVTFERTVYASPNVLVALRKLSQSNCTFCESALEFGPRGTARKTQFMVGKTDTALEDRT
jgi:hypothetical protein